MQINFDIKLTKTQRKAYNVINSTFCNVLVCRWSRQCGKSVFAEIMCIEALCKKDKFSAYITPTYQLGRKVFKELVRLLENKGIISKANSSTLTIESVFGSTLQFFSTEAYTAIRGNTISGILILDEAAYYPLVLPNGEDIWSNVIMPITKARKPKIIVISTPNGKQGFFYELYQKAVNKIGGYKQITATIYDDELITLEQIEEIKSSISDIAFRQEFMCEFLDGAISYFTGYNDCFDGVFKYGNKNWVGFDLSANGKDETIGTIINEDGTSRQIAVKGSLDEKYVSIAQIINSTPNVVSVYIETNGVGSPMYNEVKKLVKNKSKLNEWITTNDSKNEILSDLAMAIAKKDIHFEKDNSQLRNQFSTFVTKYTKTGKITASAAGSAHDDRVLSLAIAYKAKNDNKIIKNNITFSRGRINLGVR